MSATQLPSRQHHRDPLDDLPLGTTAVALGYLGLSLGHFPHPKSGGSSTTEVSSARASW